MNITGHGKGYGYDVGGERDVSVMLGIAELIVYFLLVFPCSVFVFQRMRIYGKRYVWLTMGVMVLLFVGGVFVTGGFYEFLSWFGIS